MENKTMRLTLVFEDGQPIGYVQTMGDPIYVDNVEHATKRRDDYFKKRNGSLQYHQR